MSKWDKHEIKSEVFDAINRNNANGKNLATESGIASTFKEWREKSNETMWLCTKIDITPENVASILNESILQNEDIKNADLILVYRDNICYTRLFHDLERLLKEWKYGWKIVCLAIDKNMRTERDESKWMWDNVWFCSIDEVIKMLEKPVLHEEELSILAQILKEYRCACDHTISQWTSQRRMPIIDDLADNTHELLRGWEEEKVTAFIQQCGKISEICNEKWIKTIYLVDRAFGRDTFLLTHGWLCQKEDGTIYNIKDGIILCKNEEEFQKEKDDLGDKCEVALKWSERHREILEDAKRYWTNIFPNQKVIFVESPDWRKLLDEVDGGSQSLLIVDRHAYNVGKYFKNHIFYAWYKFQPDWWYEEFMHDGDIKLWLDAENILKYLGEKKW